MQINVLRSPGAEETTAITFHNYEGNPTNWWYSTPEEVVLDGSRSSTLQDAWPRPPERAIVNREGGSLEAQDFHRSQCRRSVRQRTAVSRHTGLSGAQGQRRSIAARTDCRCDAEIPGCLADETDLAGRRRGPLTRSPESEPTIDAARLIRRTHEYPHFLLVSHFRARGFFIRVRHRDALGNITSRTGIGAYTYDTTRKHRLLSAGTNTYSYDNNGNVTAKNGQPITWYSYNLPRLISSTGSNSSEFFYAPDRSRWKQVASYGGTAEQTIYIGGLVEKVTRGSVTSWKHYVAGADAMVAEVIRRSNGTNETVYLLKDHLGSTEVVTNSSGGQMSRLAYGAQGARRNGTTWSGAPSSTELTTITNTTRRGYTSHEMLDNLSLVNMNGRIYDPDIGRFLSADPLVQAPGFTQSFNRYSYAWNNPLRYTDPSGFSAADEFPCKIGCLRDWGDPELPGWWTPGLPFLSINHGGPRHHYSPRRVASGVPRSTSAYVATTENGNALDTISVVNTAADVLIPGKSFSDSAVAAFQEGRYAYGAVSYGAATLDVYMAVATLGVSTALQSGARSIARAASVGAVKVRGARVRYTDEIALGLTETASGRATGVARSCAG